MKQKTNKPIKTFKCWTIAALAVTVTFSSCQKETSNKTNDTPIQKSKIQLPLVTSPYSLRNVQKAQETIAQNQSTARTTSRTQNAELPQYVYFKFSPDELTAENFKLLEDDSIVKLIDFPFANAAIYSEDFALDETKKEQLTDGSIYGVTNIENNEVLNVVKTNGGLRTQFLDTLALIPEEDTTLQYQAFREAGGTEEQISRLRICLFKRPTGYVRYWDDEFGRLEAVRTMQVWGLVFGIPLHTYTDDNGYYRFPWRFSAGTIMGTNAKNSRVNIKPFNTMGGFFQVMGQLIINFIVGSVHVKGWVSSCDMRGDVNFDFYDHKQNKYWSQLLNAYYFHDQYAKADGIKNAPQNLVCYAHWADAKDFGSASTPMLRQMLNNTVLGQVLGVFFNGNTVSGTLLRLARALAPDMTFKVCGGTAPTNYNSRLAQIAFHELGHASMYRQVGATWHFQLLLAELSTGSTYGSPGYSNWGKVQVAESWTEFIGTDNAARRYGGTGVKRSAMLSTTITPYVTCSVNTLENEDWFSEYWIPSGFYNDLIDITNLNSLENSWDKVGGSSIRNIYSIFNSNTSDMCTYGWQFSNAYPPTNPTNYNALLQYYGLICY